MFLDSIDLSIEAFYNPLRSDYPLTWSEPVCASSLLEPELFGEPKMLHEIDSFERQSKDTSGYRESVQGKIDSGMKIRIPLVYLQRKTVGTLTIEERRAKVAKFLEKRKRRVWHKKINYSCRKEVAEKRIRLKGRFVTKEEASRLQMNSSLI